MKIRAGGRLVVFLFLLLFMGGAGGPAHAGPIVNGLEWYQPAALLGYSWNQFDATCGGGSCSGLLGGAGPDLTGWTWASADDVGALFAALTPHPGGIASVEASQPADVSWGFDFLGLFDVTNVVLCCGIEATGVLGVTSTPAAAGSAYYGEVSVTLSGAGFSARAATDDTVAVADTWAGGGWLYRAATVPAPGSASLLGLALAGLWCRRKLGKLGAE